MNAPLNVRDYSCAKVRRRMDSYLAGELSVDLSHEILEHLERDPACRAELQARENLRAAVRRIAAATPEPRDGFEAEVRDRIAKAPPTSSASPTLLLAASLVAAVGLASYLVIARVGMSPPRPTAKSPASAQPVFAFAALNHRNCTLKHSWPKEDPPSEEKLEAHLDGELAGALHLAASRLPGYVPVAAHLCSHAGEKVFHVIFRREGTQTPEGLVSILATRPGSTSAEGIRLAGLNARRHDGFQVVGASARDGRLIFLVMTANEDEAMHLARSVLPALAVAFLARP
ncbi:MAG: anti-sigma factor family protein [Thermoanaerobaculia bacterium]